MPEAEKAGTPESKFTRPLTTKDAKVAGMATMHTVKDLPEAIIRESAVGLRNSVRAIWHLSREENSLAAKCARQGVIELLSPFMWPITIAPDRFQANLEKQRSKMNE